MSTSPQNPDERHPRARDRGVPSYDPGLFDDPDLPGGGGDPLGPSVRVIPATATPSPEPTALDAGASVADGGPDTGPGVVPGGGVRPAPTVDTGRLYRSAGADATLARGAIPALSGGESVWTKGGPAPDAARRATESSAAREPSKAHPVVGTGDAGTADAQPARMSTDGGRDTSTPAVDSALGPTAGVASGESSLARDEVIPDDPAAGPTRGWVPLSPYLAASGSSARGGRSGPEQRPGAHRSEGPVAATPGGRPDADDPAVPLAAPVAGGLTWTGVTVVMVLVTVALAFAQVLVRPDDTVWFITGIGYALATVYCALTVRLSDLWAAFVVPPLAWLVALLTAGQLTLGSSGSLVIREGLMIFGGLALNAPWIVGSALAALVVILVRRTRARRAGLL